LANQTKKKKSSEHSPNVVKNFPKKEKKRKEKNSLNLMISFQRKYCDRIFPFYFDFSYFGEISQLGTPKKKKQNKTNKLCCPQVGLLSFYRTKWSYPLRFIWTFSNSEVARSFSGGPPKLRGVLLVDRTHHKVGLYASLLIWTFSRSSCEEGASERASEADTQ
jgi:hypothetical protein